MTALSDAEDAPPMQRVHDEHAATIPPDPPIPRLTLKMSAAKADEMSEAMARHEAARVAEFLGNLDAKLTSIDAGVKASLAASERAEVAAQRARADVHLWLFGDGMRPGLAQAIDATNQLAKDALEKSTEAASAALEALTLTMTIHNATLHPASDEERAAAQGPNRSTPPRAAR